MTKALRNRRCGVAAASALVLAMTWSAQADDLEDPVERGDRFYAERGESNDGRGRAEPQRILAAIEAYEEALVQAPSNLEARWKTMAALFFAGDFASSNEEAAHAFYDRGRALGEEGIALVRERYGGGDAFGEMDAAEIRALVPEERMEDVGSLYFWAAIHWGAWSRTEGLLTVVSKGVAGRLRNYARVSLALDPTIYRGGNQRLLAHLHANLPRVPFVSGWVDREKALGFAEDALAIQADDIGNRVIWGLVVLDVAPRRRDEGLAVLESVVRTEPRAELVVEDQATREMARERLDRER